MRGNIITFADQQIDFNQFCDKIEKYEIELTRGDIVGILKETKENNPSLIPALLNVVKRSYHLNLSF